MIILGVRTDLAIEFAADKQRPISGVESTCYKEKGVKVSTVEIKTEEAANTLGKPKGKYITLESENTTNLFELCGLCEIIAREVKQVLCEVLGTVLVVGIGNVTVTPDALGPKVAEGVLATRHISGELAEKIGLKGLKSVSVLSPGVLGQTGMEVKEVIEGAISAVTPSVIVLVDALAARDIKRLCNTVQISNRGICPGSGVGNSRSEISRETVGVRCVTIGVPTVVDASTLCFDLTGNESPNHEPLIVTPRDIDRLIERSSKVIAEALNIALQPEIDSEILTAVV